MLGCLVHSTSTCLLPIATCCSRCTSSLLSSVFSCACTIKTFRPSTTASHSLVTPWSTWFTISIVTSLTALELLFTSFTRWSTAHAPTDRSPARKNSLQTSWFSARKRLGGQASHSCCSTLRVFLFGGLGYSKDILRWEKIFLLPLDHCGSILLAKCLNLPFSSHLLTL